MKSEAVGLAVFLGAALVLTAQTPPDPAALLKSVADDRSRIRSGSMEIVVTSTSERYPERGVRTTELVILFDGSKRLFESTGREYAYLFVGEEATDILKEKLSELGVYQESAVEAGLMHGWNTDRRTLYLGDAIYQYEADSRGRSGTVGLRDSERGVSQYLFDPRIFGLTGFPYFKSTLESLLQYTNAAAFQLTGEEVVNETDVWHIHYSNDTARSPYTIDFWVTKTAPHRVLKQFNDGNTTWSEYLPDAPEDPLPVRVEGERFSGLERHRSLTTFVRSNTRYNIDIDPKTWTIAGLNPPVGTEISDERIHRRIGYWDGTTVTESYPPNAPRRVSFPPEDQSKLLNLALAEPETPFAREAAIHIVAYPVDEASIGPATELLIEHHLADARLARLAETLIHNGRQRNIELLRLIIAANPDPKAQGIACYALACVLKYQAAGSPAAKAEARQLFDRAITDYGEFEVDGKPLAERARWDRDR